MGYRPFLDVGLDLAAKETRTATVFDWEGIPPGEYGFVELYCDDPKCDCRRVMIQVFPHDPPQRLLATINFGWESPAFYAKWSRIPGNDLPFAEAVLDPLNPQSQYSDALLALFKSILEDPAYVERLKRHYRIFKDLIRRGKGAARSPRGRRGRPRR